MQEIWGREERRGGGWLRSPSGIIHGGDWQKPWHAPLFSPLGFDNGHLSWTSCCGELFSAFTVWGIIILEIGNSTLAVVNDPSRYFSELSMITPAVLWIYADSCYNHLSENREILSVFPVARTEAASFLAKALLSLSLSLSGVSL